MGKGEVVGPVVVRELRGRPTEVANALRTMQARGELVDGKLLGYWRGRDPYVAVKVRVIDRQPPARRRGARWVVIGVCSAVGVLGGGGYVAYLLTRSLLVHAAAVLGAAVVLAAVGWILAGQVGACPGLHCPGCKCGRR